MSGIKFVDFFTYCKTCKHEKYPEEAVPCSECLSEPVNQNSSKPVCWKEKENAKKTTK